MSDDEMSRAGDCLDPRLLSVSTEEEKTGRAARVANTVVSSQNEQQELIEK